MSLQISHANGIFTIKRSGQTLGQGRSLELAIENAVDMSFPTEVVFGAAEVILSMLGPLPQAGNTQIGTREP